MKKLIIAGITMATLVSASIAPAFANTKTSGTSVASGTTVTSNGLRELW